jgi:hypothetical protein
VPPWPKGHRDRAICGGCGGAGWRLRSDRPGVACFHVRNVSTWNYV